MPAYVSNPMDWLKIAVIAYVAVKAVNFTLDKIGQPDFKI